LKVMLENRVVILRIIVESFTKWKGSSSGMKLDFNAGMTPVVVPVAKPSPTI
jgi:hypothetical protein